MVFITAKIDNYLSKFWSTTWEVSNFLSIIYAHGCLQIRSIIMQNQLISRNFQTPWSIFIGQFFVVTFYLWIRSVGNIADLVSSSIRTNLLQSNCMADVVWNMIRQIFLPPFFRIKSHLAVVVFFLVLMEKFQCIGVYV